MASTAGGTGTLMVFRTASTAGSIGTYSRSLLLGFFSVHMYSNLVSLIRYFVNYFRDASTNKQTCMIYLEFYSFLGDLDDTLCEV